MRKTFTLEEIAAASRIPARVETGISYAVQKLTLPLADGSFLEFRQGDDDDDREINLLTPPPT